MKKKKRHIAKATIKDLAREAGVSPTTISIVLQNKDTKRASDATKKRILEIANRLNYKPSYIARSLVVDESHTIGLIITTLLNPFYSEISQDIIERATERGYHIIICSARRGLEDTKHLVDDTLARGVEGLILCSLTRHDPTPYELKERGIPFVLALRNVDQSVDMPSLDHVLLDDKRGAFMVVDHLIKMGHQRIGLITGPMDTSTTYNRYLGAKSAFEFHGLQMDAGLILNGNYDRASGHQLAKELLQKEKALSAVFAFNDIMAMGVLEALKEEGKKVPDDIAVIGFDDIEMSGLPGVDLTTISERKEMMGRLAVDILIDKIKGESSELVKQIILDPILVIRNSCGFYARGGVDKSEPEKSG